MIVGQLISKLTEHFDMREEIEREELETFLNILYSKSTYHFKVGDIVKITKTYPDFTCMYIGIIGSFDYGKTDDGFGPTEAIRLEIAIYTSTTGKVEITTSTAPSGETEYATEEEIAVFTKTIEEYGNIL